MATAAPAHTPAKLYISPTEAAYWNAKYSAFYVTGTSPKTFKTIQIGKPHASIEEALRAAVRIEKRRGDGRFLFVDCVKP